jgi:hypothetical protein
LTTIYLVGVKNIYSCYVRKGSIIGVVATPGGQRSPCEGFSLGKTIRFGSVKFVTDRFGRLSLSSFGDSSGVDTGPAYGEPPLL